MQVKKILNPETGRYVTVGGAKYNELVSRGVLSQSSSAPTKMAKAYVAPTETSYALPGQFKKYPIEKSDIPWGNKKPSSVGQRRKLLENCGESCFLIPSDLKFPICNAEMPCTYNCRGLKGAASRAGEWKYSKVLEKAKQLLTEYDCYVGNKKSKK